MFLGLVFEQVREPVELPAVEFLVPRRTLVPRVTVLVFADVAEVANRYLLHAFLSTGLVTPKTPGRSTAATRCAPRSCGACVVGARRAFGPFPSRPESVGEPTISIGWLVCSHAARPARRAALRVFTAPCGRRSHRGAPDGRAACRSRLTIPGCLPAQRAGCRAKVYVPPTPAGLPCRFLRSGGCSKPRPATDAVASRATGGLRWPLAPGGHFPRGAGCVPVCGALSLAPVRALA